MSDTNRREYRIQILGRTLEHLGSQMYKKRDAAIAELIANCWDAGASEVDIEMPTDDYDAAKSVIVIRDNGIGMSQDEVQDNYLIVGRNTRKAGNNKRGERLITGRKGIGKLAGFGIASMMTVKTWQGGAGVKITLDVNELKTQDGKAEEKPVVGELCGPEAYSESGTIVTLSGLKQVTAIDLDVFHQSLARRFSRFVQHEMVIRINGEVLRSAELKFVERFPEDKEFAVVELTDGCKIKYWYGITEQVIKPSLIQGFSIMVREKVGQFPPYYFGVENTASHQVGTKYFTGEIFADYLDEETADETDRIATDRQEISWDEPSTAALKEWGGQTVRTILTRIYKRKGEEVEKWVIVDDPALRDRVSALDVASQASLKKTLKTLGESGLEEKEEALEVADGLIRAYEFQQFFDITEEIERAALEDPARLLELLKHVSQWRVLESRAMLELINGRLKISDTLQDFVVNDVPERAPADGEDNMHDLVARMPWILDPDWDLYDEERSIGTQLRDWNIADLAKEGISEKDARMRYDFIAFSGSSELVVIEIKRSGYPVEVADLNRLVLYMNNLSRAHSGKITGVLICGGNFNISKTILTKFEGLIRVLQWDQLCDKNKRYYEHYRGVLEGNISHKDFHKKLEEIKHHRKIESDGTYISPAERQEMRHLREVERDASEDTPEEGAPALQKP